MNGLPQIREISTDDYVEEINKAIEEHNYLSVLVLSLMIPDICSKYYTNCGYVKWFNKYVYRKQYDFSQKKDIKRNHSKSKTYRIKFNGSTCYALRNAILHSGKPCLIFTNEKDRIKANVDNIELCVNGNSDKYSQYGEAVSITNYNDMTKKVSIRINIVIFAKKIILGYRDFLADNNIDNMKLFHMIDWDKKGNIIFTPNE